MHEDLRGNTVLKMEIFTKANASFSWIFHYVESSRVTAQLSNIFSNRREMSREKSFVLDASH